MDKIALEDARRHAGYVIPPAQSFGPTAAWRCAPKIALILAAAYVALAFGEPWLLQKAPPTPYEVVAAQARPALTPPGRENASPAWTGASFE
jgi:hypothetical protein